MTSSPTSRSGAPRPRWASCRTSSVCSSWSPTTARMPMLLGFSKGNWFTAVQRTTLKWVTTAYVGGVAQVWGADTAGNIFQCFGAAASANTLGKISSRLYDFGRWDQWKQMYKMGLQVRATSAVANVVMTADTESSTTV